MISHYSDVIMSTMASQITGVSIICSTVCSGTDQTSASLAFVLGIHRAAGTGEFPTQKANNAEKFPFDDVIMASVTTHLLA